MPENSAPEPLDTIDERIRSALQRQVVPAELSEIVHHSPSTCHRRWQRPLKVVARDTEDFARLHRRHLATLPGVAQLQSSFALRTVRQTTALPI